VHRLKTLYLCARVTTNKKISSSFKEIIDIEIHWVKTMPIIIDKLDFTPYIDSLEEARDHCHVIYQGAATRKDGTVVEAMLASLPKGIPIRVRDTDHRPFGFAADHLYVESIDQNWTATKFIFTITLQIHTHTGSRPNDD
jgi:hypothetical protein